MSMTATVLSIATPVTLVLMLLEGAYSFWKKDQGYEWKDTLGNLITTGGYQIIRKVLLAAVFIGGLHGAQSLSPFTWSLESPWTWIACFLLIDFFYYWDHRFGHEVNLLWAFHNIHHSSEKFNLTVASRLSWVEESYRWIFLAPLAFLGLPVQLIVFLKLLHRLYQVPVHTNYIGKLGWLEYILATPSQHRVHHGRNEQYLDKNYGGVLCIWDRLFGTFAEEVAPVDYGLVKQIHTFHPITIQLIGPQRLWADLQQTARAGEKFAWLFKKPGTPLMAPEMKAEERALVAPEMAKERALMAPEMKEEETVMPGHRAA